MFLLPCYWEMWVIFRHLEHSQKSHTKKVYNVFLVGLVLRFVQISSIYITSQWLKRCTDHDWGCKTSSYQIKAAYECSAFWSRTLPPIPGPLTPSYIRYSVNVRKFKVRNIQVSFNSWIWQLASRALQIDLNSSFCNHFSSCSFSIAKHNTK